MNPSALILAWSLALVIALLIFLSHTDKLMPPTDYRSFSMLAKRFDNVKSDIGLMKQLVNVHDGDDKRKKAAQLAALKARCLGMVITYNDAMLTLSNSDQLRQVGLPVWLHNEDCS